MHEKDVFELANFNFFENGSVVEGPQIKNTRYTAIYDKKSGKRCACAKRRKCVATYSANKSDYGFGMSHDRMDIQ